MAEDRAKPGKESPRADGARAGDGFVPPEENSLSGSSGLVFVLAVIYAVAGASYRLTCVCWCVEGAPILL